MANSFSNEWLTAADEEFLHQAVTSPNRYGTGQLPSILNLVFSNYSSSIHSINHLAPFGKSDHATLEVKFAVSDLPAGNICKTKWLLIKVMYTSFCVPVLTGPQFHKWHTWTTNGITLRKPFYYFTTVLSLSVLCHDEGSSEAQSETQTCTKSNKLSKLLKMSRRKNEKQLALKAKTQPKLFFVHVRRNGHLKKNIRIKDN